MKLSMRLIATTAFTVLLMAAYALQAQEMVSSNGSSTSAPPATEMTVQTTAPASQPTVTATKVREYGPPKVEIFLGYSYLRSVPTLDSGNRIEWLNGGSTSVAYNFTRHFGIAGDFGGYNTTKLRLTGVAFTPALLVDADSTAFTYLIGPRISFSRSSRVTPFIQALFGAIHANNVTISTGCTGSGCTPLHSETAFALTAGGGFDVRLHRHLALRLIQAEYLMTRLENPNTGSNASQNDVRLSTGIVLRFGGSSPVMSEAVPAPVVMVAVVENHAPIMTCVADKLLLAPGEFSQITATASDPDNDPLTYSWTTSGGLIVGSGAFVKFDSTALVNGPYTVSGHVSDGRGGAADCVLSLSVQAPTPLELKLALHSIYFPTAQPTNESPDAGLVESQEQTLITLSTDFLNYLQSKPDAHLLLEGHADPRDTVEYNQDLSQRRVARTKDFLISHGVPASSIDTKAFGEEQNLTDDQVKDAVERNPELTPEQSQKVLDNMATIILASNRRVDVVLSTTGQQSTQQYPFNAADSLTLLNQHEAK